MANKPQIQAEQVPYNSSYTSKDALLVDADIHGWASQKRKSEIQKLLSDFMRHAQGEQSGICDKCTSALTQENIKESPYGFFIHRRCPAPRRWFNPIAYYPWTPTKRYLRRHGVA